MNLTLNLTPEIEARLKEQAAAAGKPLEAIVLEALEEQLGATNDDLATSRLSDEQWHRKLNETLASLPKSDAQFVDDSRESIYKGRGE